MRMVAVSGREHGWSGPAGNTGRTRMVVVEVRQGTLGVDGQQGTLGVESSGREHWAWVVVVEVRQRTLWIAGRS